jgi:hypothetical protein
MTIDDALFFLCIASLGLNIYLMVRVWWLRKKLQLQSFMRRSFDEMVEAAVRHSVEKSKDEWADFINDSENGPKLKD